MHQTISTLPVISSFMKFCVAQTSRTRSFSSIYVKLNISVISEATILIFLVNLPMVNIYKFNIKKFDPTSLRTSRTTSRGRSTKKVWATQNFMKYEMTGRVDIYKCIFEACNFILLQSFKISQFETLKLLEVLVFFSFFFFQSSQSLPNLYLVIGW